MAFARYKNIGAYCALAMEIEVERETGAITVHRVQAAVDAGQPASPDGIRNQVEGGIIQSLSWATREAVSYDATRRTSFDWGSYPILRFEEVPGSVAVHVMDRPGDPFLGAGETAQGPTSAALANAIADATGARLRDMPFTPESGDRAGRLALHARMQRVGQRLDEGADLGRHQLRGGVDRPDRQRIGHAVLQRELDQRAAADRRIDVPAR